MSKYPGPSVNRGHQSPTMSSNNRNQEQHPRWTIKDEVYETRRDLEIISRHFQTLSREVGESVTESTRNLDEIRVRQEVTDKENKEMKDWLQKQCHDYFELMKKILKKTEKFA